MLTVLAWGFNRVCNACEQVVSPSLLCTVSIWLLWPFKSVLRFQGVCSIWSHNPLSPHLCHLFVYVCMLFLLQWFKLLQSLVLNFARREGLATYWAGDKCLCSMNDVCVSVSTYCVMYIHVRCVCLLKGSHSLHQLLQVAYDLFCLVYIQLFKHFVFCFSGEGTSLFIWWAEVLQSGQGQWNHLLKGILFLWVCQARDNGRGESVFLLFPFIVLSSDWNPH